jgi:DNA-binding transcriptional ArsR family regulator
MNSVSKSLSAPSAAAMEAHAEAASRLLKAMANASRLQILCLLGEAELSVSEINERVPLSQSALSQHLAVLRADGLVVTRREAQTIYYAVAPGPAIDLIHVLHQYFCAVPRRTKRLARST